MSYKRVAAIAVWCLGCGSDPASPDARPVTDTAEAADAPADAGPPTSVTLTVFTTDGAPAATGSDVVLISDNGGPWTPVSGTDGVFTATVVGPRYAFARQCADTEYTEAWIFHLTLVDGTAIRDVNCKRSPDTATVTGAVAGVAEGQYGFISIGGGFGTGRPGTNYSLKARRGTGTLAAWVAPSAQPRIVQRFLIQRGIDITGDRVIDVDFAAGVAAEDHAIAGAGGGSLEQSSSACCLRGARAVFF
ncbi:MAG: hypothetical protein WKG01_30395 [Kofleriaceae bacterium]